MSNLRLSKLSLGLIAALAAAPVFAQSTSAGLDGRITTAAGQPVAGAEVTITHVESGTTTRATTDATGRYSARGLRVGGPYRVAIHSAAGDKTEDGLFFDLDKVAEINTAVGTSGSDLGTVTVTGSRANLLVFQSDNKGMSTSVSAAKIEATPAGNRSIDDIARLDPRVQVSDPGDGSISLAGLPNRYNNIAVDGMGQGDPFGLNSNGMPYVGSPISPDTIAAYDISTTKFDTSSSTLGADINAVTKSGTNTFHGSIYYALRNASSMVGNAGWLSSSSPAYKYGGYQRDWTGGITFGGPIIRDRLFFFVSAEHQTTTGIGSDAANGIDPALGSGASTLNKISPGDLQKVIDAAGKLGLKPGVVNGNSVFKDRRYLAKFDWNINDAHRASLTLQRTKEVQPIVQGNGSSSVGLDSYWYTKDSLTENAALQLFSDWSDAFSTEGKVGYQKFVQEAGNALNQPAVQVNLDPKGKGPNIYLGEDQYRHLNTIRTRKLSTFFAGTWNVGDHAIKGGVAWEKNDIYNLFGRTQHGSYVFWGVDNFAKGAYNSYNLYQPAAGYTINDVAASWTYKQLSFFLQDTWQATDRLSVMFGARVDIPSGSPSPLYNPNFEKAFGYPNNVTVKSKNRLFQPRFGFNYQLESQYKTQLRGGFGLFQTVPPTVWLTNPYQNNGLTVATFISFDPASVPFSADPNGQNRPAGAGSVSGVVDTLSANFKMPSAWKYALAFDRELPWWNMLFSAEALHIRTKSAIFYQAINFGAPTSDANGNPILMPDGRYQYWCTPGGTASREAICKSNKSFDRYSTLLDSTYKGHADAVTLSLSKPLANDWAASIAMTWANAKEVNPGNSSQASSGYRYVVRTNPNDHIATVSDRNTARSVKASLTWRHALFGNYNTMVSAFYSGSTGMPYSWIFSGDMNGDGNSFYDPVYIPHIDDAKVTYASGTKPEQIKQFQDFISGDKYLNSHRGQIASRNGARYPWVNQLDLAIQQELPGFFKDHKGIIRLDIFNFLNLVNKNWGITECTLRDSWCSNTRTLAGYDGVTPDGKIKYTLPTDKNGNYQPQSVDPRDVGSNPTRVISRWSILATLKYTF